MTDSVFRIAVDLGELIPEGAPFNASVLPNLAFAVSQVAEEGQRRWIDFAMGAALPSGRSISNRSGEYARSIMLRQLGDFSAEVYSELAYAGAIEEGSPARDLKDILSRSLKVRISAKGKRYLIIPFRHFHPGSVQGQQMPRAVHDWWQDPARKASAITGHGWRDSGTGAVAFRNREGESYREQRGSVVQVRRRTYSWGSRLSTGDLAGMGIGGTAAKRLTGMYNFRKPGAAGGSAHSSFITFRVMSEDSPGWKVPAREGYWPARTVAQELTPVAENLFRKAVEEDVRAYLGGAGAI